MKPRQWILTIQVHYSSIPIQIIQNSNYLPHAAICRSRSYKIHITKYIASITSSEAG